MANTNTATTARVTVTVGQLVTVNGREWAVDRLDLRNGKVIGVWLILASDYAAGRDAQMMNGYTGGYYTAKRIGQMIRVGSWVWA